MKDNKNSILDVPKEIKYLQKEIIEKVLNNSEEHFKILFAYTPDGYYISDLKGNIIYGNKAVERITGYKHSELVGKNYFRAGLLSLKDISKTNNTLGKNRKEPPTKPQEFTLKRKDGTLIDVEISTYPVRINGKMYVLGIVRNITKRKELEQEIKKIENYYYSIFENTGTASFIVKQDKTISQVNHQFEKLSGYTKKEIEDKMKWPDFVHKDDLKKMEKYHYLRRQKNQKPPLEYEFRFKDRFGNLKDIFIKVDLIPKTSKSVVSLMDITELKQSQQKLKKTLDATIQVISNLVETRDPYTGGHQERVSQLAAGIARELKLPQDKIKGVRIVALIHDIGKIGIPVEILIKPTKLADAEYNLIKKHPRIGYDILKDIDFPYPVAQIVLQHQERLDGSGYPNRLKGEDILLEAKIIAVADTVEAMSSHRPYRPALGVDTALNEIAQNKGILYDPEIVDACIKLFKEKEFKFK